MARVIGPGATASGYHLPGVWEMILTEEMAIDGSVDPRCLFDVNEGEALPPPTDRQRVWSRILADMLSGTPVVISAVRLGGNSMTVPRNVWPFNSRSTIRAYRITPDDIVTAAETADVRPTQPNPPTLGRVPNGQGSRA